MLFIEALISRNNELTIGCWKILSVQHVSWSKIYKDECLLNFSKLNGYYNFPF